jgi:hypothetical protein
MLAWFRRFIRDTDRVVWLVVFVVVAVAVVAILFLRTGAGQQAQVIQLTIDAASTQSNLFVPTLAAYLTQTPVEAALTGAAPTLSLSGRLQVSQFAAAAVDPAETDTTRPQGAVQAVGLPNTEECGDFRTAWAAADLGGMGSLRVLFAELVTPTGLLIYESFNPGFISRVEITDLYGEVHVVYEGIPQLKANCPFPLVIAINDADYQANSVTIYVDQRGSLGGANQIDAVELIGIKH